MSTDRSLLPPPTALAFDLDGTLVDSVEDLTTGINAMLAERDRPPLESAVVRRYVGDGARKLVERALGSEADVDAALRRFRHHYGRHLLEHTRCYAGVEETLRRLREEGLPLAVVTNKPHDFSVQIVEGLGLASFFTSVVGARKGVPVKPAPAMLERALDELGVRAGAAVWMVGDSGNDVKVAHACGCSAVGVSYGIGRVEDLGEAEAVVDGFGELLGLVDGPPGR